MNNISINEKLAFIGSTYQYDLLNRKSRSYLDSEKQNDDDEQSWTAPIISIAHYSRLCVFSVVPHELAKRHMKSIILFRLSFTFSRFSNSTFRFLYQYSISIAISKIKSSIFCFIAVFVILPLILFIVDW